MNSICVPLLALSFLLAPVFARPSQKQAGPADAVIQEAQSLWHRGEKKQAVEKVKQAVETDGKPYALSRFVNEAIRAGNTASTPK